jgi:subtilisin family serine protease
MAKKADEIDEYRQRLSPKLRMIINGDSEVNGIRSVLSGSVQSESTVAEYATVALEKAASEGAPPELVKPKSMKGATSTARVSCFVHLDPGAYETADTPDAVKPSARRGNLAVAEFTPKQIESLSSGRSNAYEKGVLYVETGSALSPPVPLDSVRSVTAPDSASWRSKLGKPTSDVIVGLIDVGGFDFGHPDFLVGGKTRFAAIWDQGDAKSTATAATKDIPGVGYGRIITAEAMNMAIADAKVAQVAPSDFLHQSVEKPGSHGTHVASIAAGNSGGCPTAIIVGVNIAPGGENLDRRQTFFDSTRLAHAVDFLFELGNKRGCPVSINISLGTNGHAHDGTSPIARWIDSALARPGRCVCVAAGNSGQEAARFEGDIGFVLGRIHASGRIAARGLVSDLEWQVVGNGRLDISENEMEIWYRPGDEFSVQVRTPDGETTDWVGPGEFYENYPLAAGTFLSIYNERYHPANGANRISVFLSPRLKDPIVGVQAGTWIVRLKGIEVRDGRYDAWIERDDPRPVGQVGKQQTWQFPSYFSTRSNVDDSSVSSLACARDVIAVGNADIAGERVHHTSSQGPTWDGRTKPDIAAGGTDVVAAKGFGGSDFRSQWISKTGTSMASPFVCGVAAQMLAREPRLTATQISGIMRRTAQPLPGADYTWQNDAGFGVIQPALCVEQITQPFTSKDKGS